jgi:flagellar biosynthesis/type III secretory pathway protein FliH
MASEWKLEGTGLLTLFVNGLPTRHIILPLAINNAHAALFVDELNRSFASGYQAGKEDGLDEGFANGYHYNENYAKAVGESLKKLDGSTASSVALLTGLTREELDELGGVSEPA